VKVTELKRELDTLVAHVDARFAQVDERFKETIATLEAKIAEDGQATRHYVETRLAEEGQTTRRHFDVVAESIRADVRAISANAAVAHQRLDENQSEHETFTGVLDEHELRLKSLERYRRR
jgi:hypothetical protein